MPADTARAALSKKRDATLDTPSIPPSSIVGRSKFCLVILTTLGRSLVGEENAPPIYLLLIRSPAKLPHPKPSSSLTPPLPFLLMDEVPPSPSSPPPAAAIPLPEPSYRSPQKTPQEDVSPESSDAARGKKHAWKRPSNGSAEAGAVVIGGAASWPALSESAKASPKSSSSDALKSLSIAPPSVSTVGFCCFFCHNLMFLMESVRTPILSVYFFYFVILYSS